MNFLLSRSNGFIAIFQRNHPVIYAHLGGGIFILAEIAGSQELEGGTDICIGNGLFGIAANDMQAVRIQTGNEILLIRGFFAFVIGFDLIVEQRLIKAGFDGFAVSGVYPMERTLNLAVAPGVPLRLSRSTLHSR